MLGRRGTSATFPQPTNNRKETFMKTLTKTNRIPSVRSFALVAAFTFGGLAAVAQPDKISIDYAVRRLQNGSPDAKKWAMKTLDAAVSDRQPAYAMNRLGIAYMAGMGVAADSAKAIMLLEKAGEHRYTDAYCTLGDIFKYSRYGVGQDFHRAYGYYSIGADSGSVTCMYDKGFMLYKGMGCNQNYLEAVRCFLAAADFKHSMSMYMLGICYRNGYGVARDTALASSYLNGAATLGCRDAMEELARPNPESNIHEVYRYGSAHPVPVTVPYLHPVTGGTKPATGEYHGFFVIYDWSGMHILVEEPMTLKIKRRGKGIVGRMVVDAASASFKADVDSDGTLLFTKGRIRLPERYAREGYATYSLVSAVLDIRNDRICGRLNLYSPDSKEPGRPVYFELCMTATNGRTHGAGGEKE